LRMSLPPGQGSMPVLAMLLNVPKLTSSPVRLKGEMVHHSSWSVWHSYPSCWRRPWGIGGIGCSDW
jgi:hypothetical protein